MSKVIALLIATLSLAGAMSSPSQDAKKASIERGKKVYESTCLACHQADGSGVPRLNPPLKKTKWVNGDKKELINIVTKGMDAEIEIDGDYFDNVMPAQSQLSDQQVADVLTYVRSSFGNNSSAITVEDVKKSRAAQ